MPDITIPYNWNPSPHQLKVLQSPERFKVLVWHRKCWKTTLAINELLRWAYGVKGTYWYVAPFYGQAKKIVWQDPEMLAKYCPPEVWSKRNNSELYLTFPNGSVLYILGADKPDSLRGPNPIGVVLDEYGDMKSDIWSGTVQPIMTANPKAWTWFVGTPKGRNDFFTKYNYAQNNPNWFSSILKASQSGIISEEALIEAKKTSTEAFYKQEYECDFLDDASSVFKNFDTQIRETEIQPGQGMQYKLGVDLGKHQDFTVITPINLHTWEVAIPDRFNKIDWSLQKARIEAAHLRWNKGAVELDTTGIGDPIHDDLEKAGITINPFKFNESTRNALLNNLVILLENRQITLPNYEPLITELKSMRYVLTVSPQGRTRIYMSVPEGQHDDCIMSLALACWNIQEKLPIPRTGSLEFSQLDYELEYNNPLQRNY